MKPDRYNTHSSTFFFYYFGIFAIFLSSLAVYHDFKEETIMIAGIEQIVYFLVLMIFVSNRYRLHRYLIYIVAFAYLFTVRLGMIQMLAYISAYYPFYILDSDWVNFLKPLLSIVIVIIGIAFYYETEMKKKVKPIAKKLLIGFLVLLIMLTIFGELRYFGQTHVGCTWYGFCRDANLIWHVEDYPFDYQQLWMALSQIAYMFMLILLIPTMQIVIKLGENNGKVKKRI